MQNEAAANDRKEYPRRSAVFLLCVDLSKILSLNLRRSDMKKFLTTLTVLTAFATPAVAQSFDPDSGTGNVLPFAHTPTAIHDHKVAARQSGLHSFAMVPGRGSVFNSESPANTGGGSLGYNEVLRIF